MYQPVFSFTDVLLIFTCFGSLFLSLATFTNRKSGDLSSVYLITFFLSVATCMAGKLILWVPQLLAFRDQFDGAVSFVYMLACLLKGVVLYLYVVSITQTHYRFTPRHKVLLIAPFIIAAIYMVFGLNTDHLTRQYTETTLPIFISVGFIVLYPWIFALLCMSRLSKARALLESYSSQDIDSTVNWLKTLVIVVIIYWSWELFTHFFSGPLSTFTVAELPHYFGLTHDALSAISTIYLYVYSSSTAFLTLSLAVNRKEKDTFEEVEGSENHALTTARSGELSQTSENRTASKSEDIVRAMLEKSLHLEKNLNIERLSEYLGLRTRDVSHAINSELGKNFFEFINYYRIEHAKTLLIQEPRMTMNDVMDASGFNSISSFFRVFKNEASMTPKQYRSSLERN